ncbi:MAG: phosphatidylserine decarboxylase family protein [Candidatus Zixiibacteriota bacterium]
MIAAFGLKFIIPGFLIAVICSLWGASRNSVLIFILAIVFALLTLFLTFFYRNPIRKIPSEKNLILSIADGTVLSVKDIENDYIGGKGKKVSIFLSVFDVHINRLPIDGRVEYVKYNPGKFHMAMVDKASDDNENCEIGLEFNKGKMIFKQIAGFLARRIEYTIKEGDMAKAGDIYGMIHFGSRAELFLPENVEVVVKKDDKVLGGETIIGRVK